MPNVVMWPSIPLSDMERTIDFMADRRAALWRVCLGGYSQYLTGNFQRFRSEDYWPEVVEAVERIRDRYRIPILIEPNSYVRRDTEAILDGVLRDSPAERAGIRRGDVIVAVNRARIGSRMQLISELRRTARSRDNRYRPPGEIGRAHV